MMNAVTNTAKVSVSFSVAAAFLLAVCAVSVSFIDHVNRILENVGFYNLQATQAAETITELRLHPESASQNVARIEEIRHLARTDLEIDDLSKARKAVESGASASQAIADLEQLSAYYRHAAEHARQQLVALHQSAIQGAAFLMGGGVVLLALIMVLVRRWFISPLFDVHDAIRLAIANDPAHPLPGNEMRELVAPVCDLVAEAKQLETRALRAERSSAVGEACTRIGQNLRNLVQSMRAMAQYKHDTGNADPSVKAAFDYIIASTNVMDHWVTSLVNASRPLELRSCQQAIEPAIRNSVSLLNPLFLERTITVDFKPADDLPDVQLDRPLFEQALVAVLKNAMDASPDEGRVSVVTTRGQGDTVRVTIADDGEGMNEEVRQRACEPFFTKRKGGVGLGLTYVQQIVELHGGKIEIESEAEKGTRIHIDIPVAATRSRPGLARVVTTAPPSSKSALSASTRQ
jgi:signal transduction histidine kinase